MSKYTIQLKNCAFFARHGVFDEENTLGQRFFIDAKLHLETNAPLDCDVLENMVDYGEVFKLIEHNVTGKRRFLIESVATDVAKSICNTFPTVQQAIITVRKPSAPIAGILDHVEVTVCWPQ